MKVLRWVFLGLYVVLILGLSVLSFSDSDIFWVGMILVGVMLLAHAMFILGSGTIQLCFPIKRHRLILPIIASATMFAVLVFGFLLAMMELFRLDRGPAEEPFIVAFWMLVALSWIGWGVLLFIYAQKITRWKFLWRVSSILFTGSLLELMATVPSHLIVIRRPGCLVGLMTMIGIISGIYVMLFSFGPMIVLLFLRPRHRQEQGRLAGTLPPMCHICEYNLTGNVSGVCPECGTPIPNAVPSKF